VTSKDQKLQIGQQRCVKRENDRRGRRWGEEKRRIV